MLKLKALLLTQGMHGMISQVEGLAKALGLSFRHETIQLKKPDEVYLEIYNEAREKAKEAKKQALLSYLELKKIKSAYPTLNFDDEDDVMDKAIENIIDNNDFQKDQTEEISKNS